MNILSNLDNRGSVEVFIKDACKTLFDEEVIVYVENKGIVKTYEAHFNDNNYYEIDFNENMSIDELKKSIIENLYEERCIDLKNPSLNRNNDRHFRRYDF